MHVMFVSALIYTFKAVAFGMQISSKPKIPWWMNIKRRQCQKCHQVDCQGPVCDTLGLTSCEHLAPKQHKACLLGIRLNL